MSSYLSDTILALIAIGFLSHVPSSVSTTILKLLGCLLGLSVVIVGVTKGVRGIVAPADCANPNQPQANTSDRPRWAVMVSIAMLVISAILASSARAIVEFKWP
jgi:hypothetical protein